MFTDHDTGQFSLRDAERSAIFEWLIRLRVPSVDMAGATGHPEKNDTFATRSGAARLSSGVAGLEQSGQCKTADAGEAGFEHAPATGDNEAFASAGVKIAEGVAVVVAMMVFHNSTRREGHGLEEALNQAKWAGPCGQAEPV